MHTQFLTVVSGPGFSSIPPMHRRMEIMAISRTVLTGINSTHLVLNLQFLNRPIDERQATSVFFIFWKLISRQKLV